MQCYLLLSTSQKQYYLPTSLIVRVEPNDKPLTNHYYKAAKPQRWCTKPHKTGTYFVDRYRQGI